eukprot:CAMPEP_0116138132 /NCGR_PEP_ID=MMETSP0329-20121206/12616_1 /TAXON_ID=697910 /ORGANISM="Pseudo-nitzschia arenysensis, Strain B593" /LENGTH=765 /DNA_ID=CAMNT_0003633089 /DNA_START=151 /DNA_END=2445 /DNA_ORIENTATION=-
MDRQLLSRATDSSEAPTPGYMYIDIAKNAAGNPQTCADVAKYLVGRLSSKNNPNVKFKCLKVIAKTAVSPYLRGQFKRCMSQDPRAMAAIKEAAQFRGAPDPVRGDAPNEKVRTAAKEALDAIYSDTPASDPSSAGGSFASSVSSSYGNPAGGFGGGGGGGYSGGAPGGGPRRMEGIGNPMFKDPRLEPEPQKLSVNELMNEAKSTVIGMIKDPLARNTNVSIAGGGNQGAMPRPGGGYSGPSSFHSGPPGRSDLMQQTGGQWTMASNRGPSAVGPPPNYGNDAAYYKSRDAAGSGQAYSWAQSNSGNAISGGVGGSWGATSSSAHQATPSITVNTMPGVGAGVSGGAGTSVSDGSYEKQLVMELCPPGGMKPEPPPDKLAQFARSVASLNPDHICPVLLDCLEEGQPWIIRAKALWVMETCIKHGQKPGAPSNAYADFLHACNGEFAPLAIHARAAIRDPAKRVLNLLGVATPVGGAPIPPVRVAAAAPAPAPVAPPPAPVANLLDFGDDTAVAAPAPAAAAAPPPASGGGGSLFGGLNMASTSAPVAAAPPAPASPAPATDNLLDLMSGGATASTATAAPQSSFGFMNATLAAPAPAPATSEATNMFGNLTLKGSDEAKPAAAEAAPAPASSAFGFMNAGANTPSTEPAAPAAAPATITSPKIQSVNSFDPLNDTTPNTRKKMMAVSPEQMQAMMYQQMMMQQQMQMAQMQMAMQQQKVGGGFMAMPGQVMRNPAASKSTFAFMEKPQKQEDHSFDFVKDAMK